MSTSPSPPVVCFVGVSGCGKTTLNAHVIAALSKRGFKVGALKHSSHGFQMDRPGKDTDRFRQAGAYAVAVASDTERAVITSTPTPTGLAELVNTLPPGLDLVLCEGFASEDAPKIGVHRAVAPLPSGIPGIFAVVGSGGPTYGVPVFAAEDVEGVCELVLTACGLETAPSAPEPGSDG